MVEENGDDLGIARLRRLVKRRRAHARLDCVHVRARLEQVVRDLRMAEPGGYHERGEAVRAATIRVRAYKKEASGARKVAGTDTGFKSHVAPPADESKAAVSAGPAPCRDDSRHCKYEAKLLLVGK